MLYRLSHIWCRSQGYLTLSNVSLMSHMSLPRLLSLQSSCSKSGISIHPVRNRGHVANRSNIKPSKSQQRKVLRETSAPISSPASSHINTTTASPAPTAPAPTAPAPAPASPSTIQTHNSKCSEYVSKELYSSAHHSVDSIKSLFSKTPTVYASTVLSRLLEPVSVT